MAGLNNPKNQSHFRISPHSDYLVDVTIIEMCTGVFHVMFHFHHFLILLAPEFFDK